MVAIRRRIRMWTFAWLVFQAASLSAFVPRDCCAAHAEHASHHAPPEQARTGTAHCPMHEAAAPQPECSLRTACNGPMRALPAVWASPAPAPASIALFADTGRSSLARYAERRIVPIDLLPATPPPRG
ncbi:MAG: hypothetical protein ACRD1U_18800 [Vicinamibacterales bacterium]